MSTLQNQERMNGASHAHEESTALQVAHVQENGMNAFSSMANFEAAQRIAKLLCASDLVPKQFKGNIANTVIAMELASRIKASPFMVMQNMDVIYGRPSFRATFLIATVNVSGRFTPLRFKFTGTKGKDDWGCIAFAKDKESGEVCEGTEVTIGIAKAEGWYAKDGSKWKTIPQQMLTYRAAAFWTRIYAPELSMGIMTAEESEDIGFSAAPAQSLASGQDRAHEVIDALPPATDAEPPPTPTPPPAPKPTNGAAERATDEQRARIGDLARTLDLNQKEVSDLIHAAGGKAITSLTATQADAVIQQLDMLMEDRRMQDAAEA